MASPAPSPPYPQPASQPDFPRLEEEVLAYWQREGVFRASVEGRPRGERGANEFVFYDGPPFANGLPHYGHLLTGYAKDLVPRYQTLRGRRVERRFGWDCHGLPAEMEAEKELGIAGRKAIEAYGVAAFNEFCKSSVMRYTAEWRDYVHRQGRWVDFENDYKTMDLSYMESVLWAIQRLWQKDLLYEGYRVMPYSWAAETPLSNFETRLDESYRERQDPALTVAFKMAGGRSPNGAPVRALVWTTTPWTLPSNLALAVGPDVEYVFFEWRGETLLAGRAAFERDAARFEDARIVGTARGSELAGWSYEPLFPFFRDQPGAFRVLAGDFVDTDEGTGIVHLAPGFGEDDQLVCQANGIAVVCPVDEAGRFTAEVPDWEGLNVLEANKPIIAELKRRGDVVRHDTIVHSYPHCWRTDQPLIYRAVGSWYVKVTAVRERMVELNQRIRWVPERVRDGQFGKWLEGARDWSISRNRFWGSPLPIWKSDDPAYPRVDVYGSLDELERDFGVRPRDLHRPAVDELTRPNPDDPSGRSTMRRVPDVLDCWFESGSMPFAQVHYPFESKEWFESHFPADFIVEYVGQTRGWFYTLMVLGTALFDRPPFKSCLCHGIVLDRDGRKLSKRLRNYPDPLAMFAQHGSDAMRWFLMSSPVMRGGDLRISADGEEIAEVVRLVVKPIWNAYSFYCLYANADLVRGELRRAGEGGADASWFAELGRLDRYVLAKARELVLVVGEHLDAYDLAGACADVRGFLEALNNWYIRRSRARFWKGEAVPGGRDGVASDGTGEESAVQRDEVERDKADAYDTLCTVLHTLARVASPLLPFTTEAIYRGLTGERSVHLADWPDPGELPSDPELVAAMDRVREVCSAGLALRERHRLRVRLPLAELEVAADWARELEPYADLVRDELNVKRLVLSDSPERQGELADHQVKVDAKRVGPRAGAKTKEILAEARRGSVRGLPGGRLDVAGFTLEPDEFEVRKVLSGEFAANAAVVPELDCVVRLDTETTDELEREGLARDVVRAVQIARREAGLDVSDRIRLFLDGPESVADAVDAHRDYVAEQVLAAELSLGGAPEGAVRHTAEVEGSPLGIALVKS